jgi:O-antigen ligase
VLAVSGFGLAIVGLTQKLMGTDLLLGLRKGGPFMFSSFVNRNNFASYINLLIPAALAVAHHRRRVAVAEGARSDASGLFAFMALIMVLSVIMTTSRAGTAMCAGLLFAWGAVELAHSLHGTGGARRVLLAVLLTMSLLIIGLLYLGTEPVEQRLGEMRAVPAELAASGGRGNVYVATLQMWRDHWLYGVGGGTFSLTYPYYSVERMDWFRRYAHNDWLQYLVELGVTGSVLLGLAALGLMREQVKRGFRFHLVGSVDWLAVALSIGLVGVALHALVDFPLHIPAISTLAITWLAILTQPALQRNDHSHARHCTV